jgi:membrane-bound inhibitor of C-type lysozyme
MFKKSFLMYLLVSVILALLILAIGFSLYINQPVSEQTESPVVTGQTTYQCMDGHTVEAVFMTQGPIPESVPGQPPVSNALVSLSLDGATEVLLPHAISADGSRYANADESFVFWSKGNGAMVLQNDKEDIFQNCIVVKEDDGSLPQVYLDSKNNFTLRYPADYTVNDSYSYELLGPNRAIAGVKFTIPASMTTGTNLSSDSYISIEHLTIPSCSPKDFLPVGQDLQVMTVDDGNFKYLSASTTDAGVGNRYEEYVYAIDGANPCLAIRYFIHYSVFENYPAGAVTEFDKSALLAQFDAIRGSLTIDAQFVPMLSLNADVYPLYENLSWQGEGVGEYGDMNGYMVVSEPIPNITDIAAITQPFEKYYADQLIRQGWEEDISMAAGGPGSAVIAYKKGSEYIILQYTSEFGVNNENEPAQCPCSVQFSVFSGK